MSVILTIDNFSPNNVRERAELSAQANVGAAALSLKSVQNVTTNLYALVGQIAGEVSELRLITGITNLDVTVAALLHEHAIYTAVYILNANQAKIYRAANVDGRPPADDDYTLIGTAIDLDYDDVQTSYTDATGSSDYWYKTTFYNSATSTETSIADAVAARGDSGGYATLASIRQKAGFSANKFITNNLIIEKRAVAQDVIDGTLVGIYTVPFTAPINPQIAEITRLLAAGYLLNEDYGIVNNMSTKSGDAMIKAGMDALAKLDTKEQRLIDGQGNDTSIGGTSVGVNGYPDASTEANGGGGRMFSVTKRY